MEIVRHVRRWKRSLARYFSLIDMKRIADTEILQIKWKKSRIFAEQDCYFVTFSNLWY